jgi:hypothetical protein
MIIGKTCFIHLRDVHTIYGERGLTQEFKHTGGVTLAWEVDEFGNLIVGAPARCLPTERFVKSEGRDYALKNLNDFAPLLLITPGELAATAIAQSVLSFDTVTAMVPSMRKSLVDMIAARIKLEGVDTVMGSSWYEDRIRERIEFKNNNVTPLDFSVEYQELLIKADVVLTSM